MITIDPEFRDLIPPLEEAEFLQLEANIRAEGCREPLMIWNGILIDGHHRYRICTENNIPYKTQTLDLADRGAVREWIIKNQWGRRNLTAYQRAALALKLEPTLRERAKQNQRAGGKGLSTLANLDTRSALARIAGVGAGTIAKVKRIEESATDEQREKLRSGESTISHIFHQIEGAAAMEGLGEAERTLAERKLSIARCLADLDASCRTLDRLDVSTGGLRKAIEALTRD